MKKKLWLLGLSLCGVMAFSSCAFLTPTNSGSQQSGTSESVETSESTPEIKKYKITFQQAGRPGIDVYVTEGESLAEEDIPAPQAIEGYTIVWEEKDLTNVKADIVVNAIITANEYTITYDVNGGNALTETTQKVTYNEDTTLVTPEKEGYFFVGWYYQGAAVVNGKWAIAGDVTLVAQWEDQRPTYKVTFVQGDQSKEVVVKKGESVAAEDVPALIEKTGYSVSWDKTDYTNIQADMTVTAEYTAKTYTVTYDADGFAIDGTTVTLTYDSACTALDMTLTQDGYNFLGWKYGNATYTKTSVWNVADNVTLTADWAAKDQVVVTFTDTNGSTINKTVYKGASLTDIPTPTTKTGYTVDTQNWYANAECTVVATFTNLQENVTVYAKATANKYTVSYNANGGAVVNATQEVTYNADYTLETPTHTESYMRFDGWKDGEGNTIAITGKWTTDSGMTLTAQWTDTRETYTISFVQAGQATKTFSVKEGEDFTEIPTPVAKTGYTIVWDKTDFTNVQESMTVNAKETANTYTITYDVNGGSALTETTQKVTYDEAYTVKDAPTKSGYTFTGWYIKGTDTKFENGTWTTDGDVAVEARWEKLPEEEWTKNY